MPRPTLRHAARALAIVSTGCVLLWHAHESWTRFPPGRADSKRLPFTEFDHTFHFYYSQLTRDFFAGRLAFWGYDPNFMAGYGKTMIFPTSSTLPELVAIVSGEHGALGYRAFVASTILLTPLVLALAARAIWSDWLATMLAALLGVVWVWSSWPAAYVTWGMGPFILASAISVWSGSLLADWLDRGSAWSLSCGTLLTALAVIAHPSSLVILACMMLPAYLSRLRSLGRRAHVATCIAPAVVAVAWSPWWLPAVVLRDTFGTTASGFINPEVWTRLWELLSAQHPTESALLLACPVGFIGLWRVGPARFWALLGGALGLFALAYFASALAALHSLQPGRYTQPLYAVLVVQVASGCPQTIAALGRMPSRRSFRLACGGVWLCLGGAAALAIHAMHSNVVQPRLYPQLRPRPLRAELPAVVTELAADLREWTDSSGRILLEDRAQLNLGPYDPFQGTNPSALMPLLAPGQYIGGPYLRTHLKSNFTQVGDGKFFGRDLAEQPIDLATFQRYAELYNIRWAVLRFPPFTEQDLTQRGMPHDLAVYWSAPLARLAAAHPDYFRLLSQHGYLRLYELAREPNWAIAGSARVRASPDRVEISDAEPNADGVLILSYHWIRTLRSTVPLRPVYVADDPVPFIAVDDPPRRFVIESRLW
jgi:hypothetical protein